MLSDSDRELFAAARQAQLNRNNAISIVTNPATRDAAIDCFVRVLLELPSRQEDYVVARVGSTLEGEPYSGFSTVPTQVTQTYLVLNLPQPLATINGVHYQLNSVSNSGMREHEFARWLELMRQEGAPIPRAVDLLQVGERLRQAAALVAPSRGGAAPNGRGSDNLPVAPMVLSSKAVPSASMAQRLPALTSMQSRPGGSAEPAPGRMPLFSGQEIAGTALAPRPNTAIPSMSAQQQQQQQQQQQAVAPVLQSSADATARNETEDEKMTRKLRQEVMNHMATEGVIFPRDTTGFKLSRLRLTERDMLEYLQHVREEIASKQENCVVCMDRVPTVILLPCKHKVMCRLCATSVSACPVCRSPIAEMFEPEEI